MRLALWLLLACIARAVGADPAPASPEFFLQRVKPLLEERCLGCHGEVKHKNGLKLNDRAAILAGGMNGPAIEPGNPQRSLLMAKVRARGTDEVMPPEDPALSDQEITDLAAWIAAGAIWVHANGTVEGLASGATTATGPAVAPAIPPAVAPPEARPTDAPPSALTKTRPPLIGRLHPLVVHFPVACLMLALLAEFLFVARGPAWAPAVNLMTAVGVGGAIVAVLTGTWFANKGSMFNRAGDGLLNLHEYAGWITLLLALTAGALLLASRSSPRARRYFRLALIAVAIAVSVTGHLGGTHVHGPLF